MPKEGTRPTAGQLREALFNVLGPSVENARVLDLFAGSGAVGIEALSRGASRATFVEQNVAALKRNIALLELETRTQIYRGDVHKVLSRLSGTFELIFADPPYQQEELERLLQLCAPLLAEGGRVFIEESVRAKPLDTSEDLPLTLEKRRTYGGAQLLEFS